MENNTDSVNVYCRLKPLFNENFIPCIKYENQFTLSTYPPEGCRRNTKEMKYSFTKVFDDCSTQTEIFNDIAYPIVDDLLNNRNGLLFAYGVTGSGKTYTMEGCKENPGIVGRTIKSLFTRLNCIQRFRIKPDERNWYTISGIFDGLSDYPLARHNYARKSGDYECKSYIENVGEDPFKIEKINYCTVFVSMVEIYGNNIKDLLIEENDKKCEVIIKEDPTRKHKYLHNLKQVEVQSASEALNWFLQGQKRRRIASTNLNDQSSRSHCVFNIRLVRLDQSKGDDYSSSTGDGLFVNELSLVDLAGSERAKRTGACGVQLKEAGDINNSLMDLQLILKSLREKQKTKGWKQHINYRANTLTRFFKTNFENDCNVRMIICVQQNPEEYDETLNVLSFAEGAREVKIVRNTPRPQKVPFQVYNTIKENGCDGEDFGVDFDKLNEELCNYQDLMKSYRNVQSNETANQGEMIQTMINIVNNFPKVIELNKKLNMALIEIFGNDDDSDQEDSIKRLEKKLEESEKKTKEKDKEIFRNVQIINKQNSENKNLIDELKTTNFEKVALEKKLEELEKKNKEKDKEIARNVQIISKQNSENKNLNDQIRKHDELESKLKGEKLNEIMEKSSRKSIRANPERTVQVIKQKFENVQATPRNVFVNKTNKQINPTPNARPYYNPCYKSTKENNYVLHKEKNTVPNGSLHHLNVKNKIESSDIKMKDLSKGNKYLLQRQSGSKDTFVTDYIEGNVTPTAGGGFTVQLTGVETVKQSNFSYAKGRKRTSSLTSDISDKKYRLDFT